MTPAELLTPRQVRAARALLTWSQQDLAKRAGVAVSTIADFERGQRTPVPNNAEAIRSALEDASINFPPGGAVVGPPIPALKAATGAGAPIRWVDATDLARWAERRDGQGSLPALIGKLVSASGGAIPHFPSDEGVQFSGWDGTAKAELGSAYVPQGMSGWEIGTQREGIASKASEDYAKRTEKPSALNPSESTFVFVTPRHWPKKDEWVAEKRADGVWRDVRVYDGTDLVHWIELHPPIGHELAVALRRRPPGTRQLEEVWQEWSLATRWPLTTDVIVSDRDEDVIAVLRWLREDPKVLSLQGDAAEEIAAFVYAAIQELPSQDAQHYLARTLVADTTAVGRSLADSQTPLIMVLLEPDPGLAQVIARKGHHVLLAYSGNASAVSDARRLGRPTPEGIEIALREASVPEDDARKLAHTCARSLTVLRRLAPAQPGHLPVWAQSPPPRELLAALLAGAWDEKSDADRHTLERLAGTSYSTLEAVLAPLAGQFDRPLRKVGSVWKIASPWDAWTALAPYLSAAQVELFEASVIDVLGSADPRYEMTDKERWQAALRGEKREHSEALRRGLSEILTMFALFGERPHTVPDATSLADRVVSKLLDQADGQRWWSLSRDFRLLAEASPSQFLSAVEHSLDVQPSPMAALFKADNDPMFGREYLSDLLWALESLAWSRDHLGRVATILAQLDEMDPGGRNGNRPGSSLRAIFVLWSPQTSATLEERLRILDRIIRSRFSAAAWRLMLGILPSGHDALSPSATTRWRDVGTERTEVVTYVLMQKGAIAIAERLLADVEDDSMRWAALLQRLGNFPDRVRLITQLIATTPNIRDESQRSTLWDAVRHALHTHRQFADADWAVPETELALLDRAYEALAPIDPEARCAWLFGRSVVMPDPRPGGWRVEDEQTRAARAEAAATLLKTRGVEATFALRERVEDPHQLGVSLVDGGIDPEVRDALIERAFKNDTPHSRQFARGMIVMTMQSEKGAWLESLLSTARLGSWGTSAMVTILHLFTANRRAWTLAHECGAEAEQQYWSTLSVYVIQAEGEDIALAAQHLLTVGRARDALDFVEDKLRESSDGPSQVKVPSTLVVEILQCAASQPIGDTTPSNEITMFQHNAIEVFRWLDGCQDVPEDTLVRLELAYLPILEYSDRKAKATMAALARNPELFVDLICALYNPSPESGIVEPPPQDLESAKRFAHRALAVLEHWDIVPGMAIDEKTIDGGALEAWVKTARKLAKQRGREAIADVRIGMILAASPMGSDQVWPAEPVRDVIEMVRSAKVESGFRTGKYNRRGVTHRSPRDGGKQERSLVEQFKQYANATSVDWPRTSAVLKQIANGYSEEARFHDDDAEQMDW